MIIALVSDPLHLNLIFHDPKLRDPIYNTDRISQFCYMLLHICKSFSQFRKTESQSAEALCSTASNFCRLYIPSRIAAMSFRDCIFPPRVGETSFRDCIFPPHVGETSFRDCKFLLALLRRASAIVYSFSWRCDEFDEELAVFDLEKSDDIIQTLAFGAIRLLVAITESDDGHDSLVVGDAK